MSTGDIYEVVDVQQMDGQELLNVYFYRQETDAFVDASGAINDAGTLVDRFVALVLPSILGSQSAAVSHSSVKVRNLFDDSDADERLVILTGTGDGPLQPHLPSFNAYAFEMSGQGFTVKNGAKRIAGVAEVQVDNGTVTGIAQIARLAVTAAAINRNLTVGADVPTNTVWRPVIVKRVRSGVKPDYKYRLPETVGEAVWTLVINTIWSSLLTSQVSRKVGR